MKARTILSSLLLIIGACRSSTNEQADARNPNSPDGSNSPFDGGGTATKTTIANMRQNNPINDTLVEMDNVVVVTQVTSSKSGRFYLQDQGGGQYSGIEVYCSFTSTSTPCGMKRADVEALTPGEVVNVVGKFSPDSYMLPIGGIPILEVIQPVVTATGNTVAPVAVDVTATDVAAGNCSTAGCIDATNPYLGSYVKLSGVTAANEAATEFAATCSGSDGGTANTYYGFEATSGSTTVDIGLGFYSTLYPKSPAVQAPFIAGCYNEDYTTPLTAGETWSSVSGIFDPYHSTSTAYLEISPTTPADFAP
jgi:hypothetical protein